MGYGIFARFARILSPITPTVLVPCARWGAPIGATHAKRAWELT